jgi:hypothetical protein
MKREQEFFPATWDKLVKIVTSVVWGLILSLTILFTLIPNLSSTVRIGIITLNVAILLVPFLWAPRGYILQKNLIIVKKNHRRFRN